MFNKNDALRKRADLRDKIAMVQANAKKQNRELTDTDNVLIDANLAEISALNSALDRHEAGAYFDTTKKTAENNAIIRGIVGAGASGGSEFGYTDPNDNPNHNSNRKPTKVSFPGLGDFINT